MLTVNFVNYYKRRLSRNNRGIQHKVSPYQFLVFVINSSVVGAALCFISILYQVSITVVLALLLIHLLILLYEFRKVEMNVSGLFKTYSWYIFSSIYCFLILLLMADVFLQEKVNENYFLVIFSVANLAVLIKVKPQIYRVTIARIKTFFFNGWKFMWPLFIYAILSWANDNFGKYYLAASGFSFVDLGIYIGVSGLVLKIVFTLSAGFDYLITEKLFQKTINIKGLKMMFLSFFLFSIIILSIFALLSEIGIPFFLNQKYLAMLHLVVPLGISGLLIKYIHMIESCFIRMGNTLNNLYGFIILLGSYFTIVMLSETANAELMCYAQLVACLIAALFMTFMLWLSARSRLLVK